MQLSELVRCQLPQGTMRAHRVVVRAARFDRRAGIVETDERMLIQTLFAQPAVEAFDVCVFHRLSRTDERQIDAMFVRPCIERLADELRLVVDLNQLRSPSPLTELLQHSRDTPAREREVDVNGRALATIAAGIASRPNCLEHELRCAPLSLGRWLSTLSQPVSSSV